MEISENLDDIAVIGFALKFPGEATNSSSFWKMLIDGRSSMIDVPKERFNIDSFCGTKNEKGGTFHSRGGNFISEDIASFDAAFFSINPTEARCMDPQQRLLLEVAYHSLESSGLSLEDVRESNTSVYVGSFMRDYEIMLSKDPDLPAKYRMSGTSVAMLANRLSWFYDLRGPSVSLDTACSSSLTALHLACQSLRTGQSKMGLVAGSNIIFGPESSIGLSDMNFLSPDSKCHSFDQRANGYARGEGIGVVVIKTVREAIKDGNTIRSIIRASATNQDGKTPGITQPNADAQEALIRQTYSQAGLAMASTRYFEAHGTGTSLGDPIEARAIAKAFKGSRSHHDPLYIGAVKSNIGHLEGASGVAGLIKAILVLENGIIPPIANLETLNPKIPANEWNMIFPTSVTPWPTSGIRRASLNSFGFGGVNVHVVLDDAYHYLRSRGLQGYHNTQNLDFIINQTNQRVNFSSPNHSTEATAPNDKLTECHKLLTWSASDENGLARITRAFESYLTSESSTSIPINISDLTYTLGEKRSSLPWKSYAVVDENRPAWSELKVKTSSPIKSHNAPKLGFIFTGQGAQWYAMGRELMASSIFRSSIEAADYYFRCLGCSWSLVEELTQRDKQTSKLESAEYGQPASTALQVALVDLLSDWKIHPSVVVGHSSGEVAAAYCAGGISRESAWRIAYYRGIATASAIHTSCIKGAMLSVGISAEDAERYLQHQNTITIGCINSPKSITLSGPSVDIDTLQKVFENDKIFCRKLKVSIAYHSKYMQEAASVYEPLIHDLQPGNSKDCVMISSVTGEKIPLDNVTQAIYWIENMISTVRFSDAISRICIRVPKKQLGRSKTQALSVNYILEIGPHSTLQGPIRDTILKADRQKDVRYGAALIRGMNAQSCILQAVGSLHCFGFVIDISKANESFAKVSRKPKFLVDLPNYPFNHETKYWLESRVSKNYRFCAFSYHELLGRRVADWNPLEARWQHRITPSDNSWVKDHIVNGIVLYPAAGMLVMAIEASRQLSVPDQKIVAYRMKDVSVVKGLVIPAGSEGVEVQLYLRPSHDSSSRIQENNWNEFRICSYGDGRWVENCRGAICVEYESENGEIGINRVVEESNRYGLEYQASSMACKASMSSKKMYEYFESFGFNYGPSFRPIQDVFFSEKGQATAKVNMDYWKSVIADKDIQTHVIHPTTLDGILQLAFPAFTKGCAVHIPTMVPTLINHLWISNLESSPDGLVEISMKAAERGYRGACAAFRAVHASTKKACIAGDFEMTYVSSTSKSSGDDESGKYYNLDWRPDVSLLDKNQLSIICTTVTDVPRSVEEVMAEEKESLCSRIIATTLKDLGIGNSQLPSHLVRYIEWMRHKYPFKDSMAEKTNEESLDTLLQKIESCDAEGQVLARVARNLKNIIKGEIDPLELLFADDLLQSYYLHAHNAPFVFRKIQKYIDALAYKSPDMKVLEIGAGTGGATSYALDALMNCLGDQECGTPRFAEYVFTDVSPGFFENAQKRFSNERIRYKVLDIEKDPKDSGFEIEKYDLIVASNVLHATSDIQETLLNVHKLLKPGGKLILFEITNLHIIRNTFIFGLLPGWWRGTEDHRVWGPLLSPSQWHEKLTKTHFSGLDISFSDDSSETTQVCSAMVSTAINLPSTKQTNGFRTVEQKTLLIIDDTPLQQNIARNLSTSLTSLNIKYDIILTENIPEQHDIESSSCIFLPDIENPWFHQMSEPQFKILQRLTTSKQLLWIFHQDPTSTLGPDRQVIMGFSRSLRSERGDFNFVTLNLDDVSDISAVAKNILKTLDVTLLAHQSDETEFMVREDIVFISRVVEAKYLDGKLGGGDSGSETQRLGQGARPLKMSFASFGLLDTLQFVDDDDDDERFVHALGHDELEIEVRAVGVNFKDILVSLGQIAETDIGVECAGVVTRVGAGAEGSFFVGDRVACAMQGAYRTYGRCVMSRVARIPADMDFATGASLLIVFATAYYCLVKIARIGRGESILIHAGAGGLGQAVIQLAKMWDANIYVTVSTEAKKSLLVDLYGIPEDHFFSSRSLAFKEGIMRMTKGKGVDIIINSLSGEALRCSWECIASLGRFIEVGRRDIDSVSVSALGGLPMRPFSQSTTFASVDLSIVLRKPDIAQELLTAVMDLAQSKRVFVPKPLHIFNASQIEEAFRFMQTGKHAGKCVVEFGEHDMVRVTPPRKLAPIFDSSATYVIAGGLGGIGRSIAKWMVESEARYLVLLSRRKTYSDDVLEFLHRLRAKGVKVLTPPCDVTNEEEVKNALKLCSKELPPIKGCIQASMVLKSALFPNMTLPTFLSTTHPKTTGTLNLHMHLPPTLTFFIMLSSHASIIGSPAQTNYASANSYQDSFARSLSSPNRPITTLNLGIIGSVGYVAEHADIGGFLIAGGHEVMSETALHRLLAYFCRGKRDGDREEYSEVRRQIISGLPLPSTLQARNLVEFPWLSRPLFRHLHQIPHTSTSTSASPSPITTPNLATRLRTTHTPHELTDAIIEALQAKIASLLLVEGTKIDVEKPIYAQGVDSLVAIEIRNWLARVVEADVAVFEILGSASLAGVGALAAGRCRFLGRGEG